MEFKLSLRMDNSSFEDPGQLHDVLLQLADDVTESRIERGVEGNVFDVNGNTIGKWEVR